MPGQPYGPQLSNEWGRSKVSAFVGAPLLIKLMFTLAIGLIGLIGLGSGPAVGQSATTTSPAYIIDANGSIVSGVSGASSTSVGPSTTLMQVDLPDGATTKPTKVKRSTTTTTKRLVAVGKPSSTVKPGPGFDPTISTLLAPGDVPSAIPDDVWAALRKCESNNRYDINTGNGYYGAYQFAAGTWRRLGYKGLPHQAGPAVQDEAAKRLQAKSGWGQWPACTRKLGLR
jgi:Transglycosylase-like domain